MARLQITPSISISDRELEEHFVLSSGPGGQNVNKVASAVELRFDLLHSSLPSDVRARLFRIGGSRVTKSGVLVIHAGRFRDQARNRDDARERLADLIRAASVVPKKRKATKPTRASKERRLEQKKNRGRLKAMRGKRIEE